MRDQAKQPVLALLSRLRDLESECLRLAKVDLPPERNDVRKTFEERLDDLEGAHSHSWFGDHSSTYFQDFKIPPAGRSFDVEWGFTHGFGGSHNPGWIVYARDEVKSYVFRKIGEEILSEIMDLSDEVKQRYSTVYDQSLDAMEALAKLISTKAMTRYTERIESDLKPYDPLDFLNGRLKSVPRMTRDSEEGAKGQAVPAHVQWKAPLQALGTNKSRALNLSAVLRNVIEAAALFEPAEPTMTLPRRVFIGHGRSEHWRSLKDFIRDRLHLEYEEFNRISPAGIGTKNDCQRC